MAMVSSNISQYHCDVSEARHKTGNEQLPRLPPEGMNIDEKYTIGLTSTVIGHPDVWHLHMIWAHLCKT